MYCAVFSNSFHYSHNLVLKVFMPTSNLESIDSSFDTAWDDDDQSLYSTQHQQSRAEMYFISKSNNLKVLGAMTIGLKDAKNDPILDLELTEKKGSKKK